MHIGSSADLYRSTRLRHLLATKQRDRRRTASACGKGGSARGDRAGSRWRLGPPHTPESDRSVRPSLRCARNQQSLFRGAPRYSRAERPLHARSGRYDLPDPGCERTGLACDHSQRPLDRHRDRQHRRLSRGRAQPARSLVSGKGRGAGADRRSRSHGSIRPARQIRGLAARATKP